MRGRDRGLRRGAARRRAASVRRASGTGEEEIAVRGSVDPGLSEEFPGLYLRYLRVERGSGKSAGTEAAPAAALRSLRRPPGDRDAESRPIPGLTASSIRHIGLDPDEQPTPVEALTLERMIKGGFVSQQPARRRADDRDHRVGRGGEGLRRRPLGARRSRSGRATRGRSSRAGPANCPHGTLVIADESRPVSLLFGATASGRGVTPATERTGLVAVGVAGVPEIAVEEALWLVADAIARA